MRFYKYLNENSVEVTNIIKRDCKKFLLESVGLRLYRGISQKLTGDIEVFEPKLREPRAMPKDIADALNLYLKSKGFVTRDKASFAIGDLDDAKKFGTAYCFFPIGNYNFTYVKTRDMNINADSYKQAFLVWYLKDYLKQSVASNTSIMIIAGAWCQNAGINGKDIWENKDLKNEIIYSNSSRWNDAVIRIKVRANMSEPYTKAEWNKLAKDYGSKCFSNKNLPEAIKNGWEVWFDSPYYLVKPKAIKNAIL